ncbi:MAG: hypothetical protein WC756_17740 [Taibaiella sp.]|jgi:hypothetical protein
MTFNFDNSKYLLPDSLKDITLYTRLEYERMYGRDLDAQNIEISKMPESNEKDVEKFLWLADSACKTLSFFSGIDLERLKTSAEVRQIMNVYTANLSVLLEEEGTLNIEPYYLFKGEQWVIVPPAEEVTSEEMSYKQFKLTKSIILDLVSLGDGNWDKLPTLCALYLRKKDETTDQVLSVLDERRELMLELPLDIALTVGIYLKDTMALFIRSLKDFKPEEVEQ